MARNARITREEIQNYIINISEKLDVIKGPFMSLLHSKYEQKRQSLPHRNEHMIQKLNRKEQIQRGNLIELGRKYNDVLVNGFQYLLRIIDDNSKKEEVDKFVSIIDDKLIRYDDEYHKWFELLVNRSDLQERNRLPVIENQGIRHSLRNRSRQNRNRNRNRNRSPNNSVRNRTRRSILSTGVARPSRRIQFSDSAIQRETNALGTRGNMTFSSNEIHRKAREAYGEIYRDYGGILEYREFVKQMAQNPESTTLPVNRNR
jgi:hypothetical protein